MRIGYCHCGFYNHRIYFTQHFGCARVVCVRDRRKKPSAKYNQKIWKRTKFGKTCWKGTPRRTRWEYLYIFWIYSNIVIMMEYNRAAGTWPPGLRRAYRESAAAHRRVLPRTANNKNGNEKRASPGRRRRCVRSTAADILFFTRKRGGSPPPRRRSGRDWSARGPAGVVWARPSRPAADAHDGARTRMPSARHARPHLISRNRSRV